jgi:hypothetical protein
LITIFLVFEKKIKEERVADPPIAEFLFCLQRMADF